jgi:hypothetical protein
VRREPPDTLKKDPGDDELRGGDGDKVEIDGLAMTTNVEHVTQ